jgi:hypothetical protein
LPSGALLEIDLLNDVSEKLLNARKSGGLAYAFTPLAVAVHLLGVSPIVWWHKFERIDLTQADEFRCRFGYRASSLQAGGGVYILKYIILPRGRSID